MTVDELKDLRALAKAMGVHTQYTDGLCREVTVAPETLVRVCAALGASVDNVGDAGRALREYQAAKRTRLIPPVLVAWDGVVPPLPIREKGGGPVGEVQLRLEAGHVVPLEKRPLPFGYHHLSIDSGDRHFTCTVISAPVRAWRRPGSHRSWGVGTHLAALRSAR